MVSQILSEEDNINRIEKEKSEREKLEEKSLLKKINTTTLPFTLLPVKFQQELEFLKKSLTPYTRRAYLVGGMVRDTLLGRADKIKEGDLEVYDIPPDLFEKIMVQIGAKGVGKSFFVYKWKNWDISLPRRESKTGEGHRGFQVELEWEERIASRRRDFTINALMWHIFTGEIKDYHGGRVDLKKRILRHIASDTFVEDSLRVLRGMQFSARLKFKIAPETVELCRQISLLDLSKERIFGEFEKLFTAPYLHYGLYYFFQLGIAQKLFGIEVVDRKTCWELFRLFYRKNPHPAYFFYHLRHRLNLPLSKIISALSPPKWWERAVATKKAPKRITNRFLYGLGWRQPLKLFITLNLGCCRKWAEKEGIFLKKYRPKKIDPKNPRKSIISELRNYPLIYISEKLQREDLPQKVQKE